MLQYDVKRTSSIHGRADRRAPLSGNKRAKIEDEDGPENCEV